MRVADRVPPAVTIHPPIGNPWTASWPVRPVLAIQQTTQPAYAWDDTWATWNDPTPLVWDVASTFPDWVDATCDMISIETQAGEADEHLHFDAAQLVAVLDNSTGAYSQYNADGSFARFGPGNQIALWAQTTSEKWWLFFGRVAVWNDLDATVEIEAFDVFSDMNQGIGTFTPGVADEQPAPRLTAILAALQLGTVARTRFDTGLVHLTRQATDQTPLEEAQAVAGSDGGALYGDADGTLVYEDRFWRAGRSDQVAIPIISINVCSAPVIVWDAIPSTSDQGIADAVILENIAKLRAVAQRSSTTRYVLSETGQQWTTQAEGDALATFLLGLQNRPRLRLDEFTLYLLDPDQPELWRAVDWRLFDRLRWLHNARTPQGTTRLDLEVIITAIEHNISAQQWTVTLRTSQALAYLAPILWDTAAYVWDDSSPAAVWGYS
jgi:hypothetical protein